jgi:hypothetical protein
VDPYVGGQLLRDWDGNSLLNADRFGTAIGGVKGNGVNATAYSFQLGLNYTRNSSFLDKGSITLSYNNTPEHGGSTGDGAIASPYTIGYATDPLYTTALIRGLVELGPGDAKRVALTQHLFDNKVAAVVAFSHLIQN